MTSLVNFINNQVVTSSRKIAEVFEKHHHNVVRDIEAIECSDNFRKLNFEVSKYHVSNQRRSYKQYLITKDGFIFLAMGFTGKKAGQFKEMYINEFNRMEAELNRPQQLDLEVDPQKVLLTGQSNPRLPLSEELAELVYKRAHEMAQESFELYVEYMKRRIAFRCEFGSPSKLNLKLAKQTVSAVTIGNALAHKYYNEIRSIKSLIEHCGTIASESVRGIESELGSQNLL